MSKVLILFATFDGQTGRIAERIGAALGRAGHQVTLRPADKRETGDEIGRHDAVIVGGAIRYGHHAPLLEKLVRARAEAIAARPNAFFSVCLSAGGPGARPASAKRYREVFARRTGWAPHESLSFAGALLYSRYNPFIRFMMRLIVGAAGGNTDPSRDYEYTDWDAVEAFAARFAERARAAHARAA